MKSYAELKAKYPRLNLMGVGFQCEVGWLWILDAYFAVVDSAMPDGAVYQIGQIKEKLGSLRIYDSSYGETWASVKAVTEAHRLAEARSYHVCEYCGRRGIWSSRRGYLTTVCADHAVADGYRAEPVESDPYMYQDEGGVWHRYDLDLDAFVPSEPPTWSQ